jgi:hypothetical protein
MEKHPLPTKSSGLVSGDLPTHVLRHGRDRDVIKMAQTILNHFTDISNETAFALLRSATKRKK